MSQYPGWTPAKALAELKQVMHEDGNSQANIDETDFGLTLGGWKDWKEDGAPDKVKAARKFITIC